MSYKYVLDSSAWVEYLGASARAVKIKELVEQESIATSILAVAELADKFEREGRAFDKTLQFMQTRAAIVQLSIPLALAAAKIKKEQRMLRTKFGLVDAIHIATARQENARFITADKDFSGMDDNIILL